MNITIYKNAKYGLDYMYRNDSVISGRWMARRYGVWAIRRFFVFFVHFSICAFMHKQRFIDDININDISLVPGSSSLARMSSHVVLYKYFWNKDRTNETSFILLS